MENLCKMAIVTGHTKSGKTVLVRRILPVAETIWVNGGMIGSPDDFWTAIVDQLELFQTSSATTAASTSAGIEVGGEAGANLFVAKGKAHASAALEHSRTKGTDSERSVTSRAVAVRGLSEAQIPLVIDDFHYLPKEMQGDIVRALKQPIFDGLAVVIIAIPHRRYDAVKVEKEMTGRILPVSIPLWTTDELTFIPRTGFRILNGTCSEEFAAKLADEAHGSPHLMQEFCRAICRAKDARNGFDGRAADMADEELRSIFSDTAETIGRPIFEKLARGPRQRKDRIDRELSDGTTVDIYGLVLHALAHLRPGLVTLEYEQLRSAIRDVSAESPPQLQEVSRVLKHMATIAATDESSAPVIDFDEDGKQLHITDPFFAFYLKWGNLAA
jgi:hypothetical protein